MSNHGDTSDRERIRRDDEIDRGGLAALVARSSTTSAVASAGSAGSAVRTTTADVTDPGDADAASFGSPDALTASMQARPRDATPVGGVPIVEGLRTRDHPHPWRRRIVRSAVLVVAAGIVYYGVTLFQVWTVGRSDQARQVDAIVVMGAAQYDGTPSPLLQARLDHALTLWSRGLAPVVVVTGGNQPGDRFTEASASARYLTDRGVPSGAILFEDVSHNSYDSLVGVRDVLRAEGLSRVLLVSDPFHSLRIRLIAQELGLSAYVSPTRTSPVQGGAAYAREAKEAAGIALGRIIGFRRLLSITG